jgi:hypothetical protein
MENICNSEGTDTRLKMVVVNVAGRDSIFLLPHF